MADIVRPTIAAMAKEGCPFQGALYVGLMITAAGPRVVEFNCRFGDPECQVLMPRLGEDVLPLLDAVAAGRGLPASVAWRPDAAVCVVAASDGYPGAYETGVPIGGIDEAEGVAGVRVFQAGTSLRDGQLVTAGGRVLGVTAIGAGVAAAIDRAYEAMDRIRFAGMHVRRDIGRRAVHRP
jgi:phosphoribosylamine--glycine ligase